MDLKYHCCFMQKYNFQNENYENIFPSLVMANIYSIKLLMLSTFIGKNAIMNVFLHDSIRTIESI